MPDRRPADDETVGALLTYWAVLEIRSMARRRKPLKGWPDDDYVACIGWLADLVHNVASYKARSRWRWPWSGSSRRRNMSWTWTVANPMGREWITQHLEKSGVSWTPPQDDR